MGLTSGGGSVITDGLIFYIDPANTKSYVSGSDPINMLDGAHTGSLKSGTSFSGENLGSWEFDGTDDYIDFGEMPPLFEYFPIGTAKDNPWSTSIWVNGYTANGVFLEFPYVEVNSLYAYSFAFAFNGTHLYFGGKYANIKIRESEPFAGGVTAFSTTNWNHVSMTFDGVDYTALSSYKLYVNGALIPIELITPNITNFLTKSIRIGGGSTAFPWLGNIGNVMLYSKTLSSDEIKQNYNAMRGRYGI